MSLRAGLRQAPLPAFFALTLAWSWACWGLSAAIEPLSSWLATLPMFAGSFGPGLAAVVVVAGTRGRAGLRAWLSHCLRWRIGWDRWAFALLFPLLLMVLAARLHAALGGAMPAAPASGHLAMTVVNFFLILLLGGPVGEEFGWRGYALPALQQRFGWRTASLGLGLVWGVWHLPLFFIAGSAQARSPLALFMLSVVAMSVVFAWLVDRSAGSVVGALLLHTAINFWPAVVPVSPTDTSHRAYALGVAGLVLVATGLLARPRKKHLALPQDACSSYRTW